MWNVHDVGIEMQRFSKVVGTCNQALHQVMTNKTTIVIAHRLATLKDMDRILVFVNGKITEDGSLNALLKKKRSHFYKLWHMQAEGFLPSIAE